MKKIVFIDCSLKNDRDIHLSNYPSTRTGTYNMPP